MNATFPTTETLPHLTPAEQLQGLIEALDLVTTAERTCQEYLDQTGFHANPESLTRLELNTLDDLIEGQAKAESEVIARAKILLGSGTLAACREILTVETAGRP
ncbi:hypothetical protein [Thalassococcus sp. S3]|uniref:hypothetical protein n=1 Tax=Thalassococcus sp. S3 TaxID=2017482 RepID=UPI00102468C5|nr:hypothetical protein [Thalassococcus sp. S3]QBF31539.1 hypothetical protein CFI11_09965 [Thalassococcus sp. S3]